MRTSDEIREAMHIGDTMRKYGGNGEPTAAEVLVEYVRELHALLRDARGGLECCPSYVEADEYSGDSTEAEMVKRISATLEKLPEEYR